MKKENDQKQMEEKEKQYNNGELELTEGYLPVEPEDDERLTYESCPSLYPLKEKSLTKPEKLEKLEKPSKLSKDEFSNKNKSSSAFCRKKEIYPSEIKTITAVTAAVTAAKTKHK